MNAYSKTAQGIADALLGRKRAAQTVSWVKSWGFGSPSGPRHLVLVTPDGREFGTYYTCNDKCLALLRNGMTPEDLELEPADDDEIEDDDDDLYWTGRGSNDPSGRFRRFG